MKFTLIIYLVLFISGAIFAQGKTAKDFPKNQKYKNLTSQIYGQWKLSKIVDVEEKGKGNGDSDSANAKGDEGNTNMQMIEFSDEFRYKLNNATSALDSGKYVVNETAKTVIFQSDLSADSQKEYGAAVKNNQLTLVSKEDAKKRYQYVYSRNKPAAQK